METAFLTLLNMSITASWLVLAVIIFRLLFQKVPKALYVILWAFVGLRLICPFSFESALSLVPSAETIPPNIMYSDAPEVHTGLSLLNSAVNPILSEALAPDIGDSVNPMQVITFTASWIWIVGMAVMLLYTLFSYYRIHRRVRESIVFEDNIYYCDCLDTPFILGVIKPRIYLPSSLKEQDMKYVIAHEQAHIKRHDHWWKPLGFALLTVYWFNPILWVAYILLCRDIELACDERVLKEMGIEIKKPYSDALINCSAAHRTIAACPLAFGEVGVKKRVKNVLNYKKPAFWILLTAVIACVAVAVCFLTNPKTKTTAETEADEPYILASGIYLAGGSSTVNTPYFSLNTETKQVHLSDSVLMSYALFGSYEFDEEHLTLYLHMGDDIYTLYLNEYGNFVYRESASTHVSESHFFQDGMVFRFVQE